MDRTKFKVFWHGMFVQAAANGDELDPRNVPFIEFGEHDMKWECLRCEPQNEEVSIESPFATCPRCEQQFVTRAWWNEHPDDRDQILWPGSQQFPNVLSIDL